jgi:septum formation protein
MAVLNPPVALVLASTSKYRKAQLARLGLTFACVAPEYDEVPVPGLTPRALIGHHAMHKALAVQKSRPDAWILGADQGAIVLDAGGTERLLGKPGSIEAAVTQLLDLAGKTHQLITAVVLALPDGRLLEREAVVDLQVRALTRAEAEAYVAQDEPLDCAGSYKIEAAGPWLFDFARGDDPTAIEGLPLLAVAALLRQAGA